MSKKYINRHPKLYTSYGVCNSLEEVEILKPILKNTGLKEIKTKGYVPIKKYWIKDKRKIWSTDSGYEPEIQGYIVQVCCPIIYVGKRKAQTISSI